MGTGKVYLIGAGPGRPELLTLQGLRALRQSDLIICDYLVPATYLDELGLPTHGKEIVRVDRGKQRIDQDEINRMMIQAARAGKVVSRLKGGDPMVFGRGKEEADLLTEREIPWEIVPGLSAGMAGPALAGLPLTLRKESRSFALATARGAGGELIGSLPSADSMVFYMSVKLLGDLTRKLQEDGLTPDTPALAIERATQPWERRVEGSLGNIAARATDAEIAPPALLLVGSIAAHYRDWPTRPKILYTGLEPLNFRMLGDLMHWPALQVVRHAEGWREVGQRVQELHRRQYDCVVFTSRVCVRMLYQALDEHQRDVRVFGGARLIVTGDGTARQLEERGLSADAVPEIGGSEGILQVLARSASQRLLLVQGANAPETLSRALSEKGHLVTRLSLHDVRTHPQLGERPLPPHDVVYFTSPSGVRAYDDTYSDEAFRQTVWCIGDVTLAEIRKHTDQATIVYL